MKINYRTKISAFAEMTILIEALFDLVLQS